MSERGISTMKIAVCDDEKREVDILKGLLERYWGESCCIDIFHSGEELLRCEKRYDIYFLDIELGGLNGVEVAERIREKDIQSCIVFVTNYEDFYRRAFAVHAFEYILKPIEASQLFKTLGEIQLYKEKDLQNREICFKGSGSLVSVSIRRICYFEYTDRKIKLVLDDDVMWLKGTIREIGESLRQYDFVMPHKAYIVNMKKIKEVKRYDIIMSNGDIVPIAQKKAAAFRAGFESYLYQQV